MMGLWLLGGSLVGVVNSLIRRWTVGRLRTDMEANPLLLTLGGMGLRLALIVVLLTSAVTRGIVSGLLAFGGLWLARWADVIWIQRFRASRPPASDGADPNGAPTSQRGW